MKEKEPVEEIQNLSEHEAEEALKQIEAEGKGLSHTARWEKVIAEVVEQSHKL